eukprot:CAMPEP_0119337828 /NCGR_PEP_ID=MMETSP1333-20130426/94788_1 /TAXON_ID=418940 /ORGANISM="Scyphosphaera apsteinii, Strain RCC1455" /LENGTH=595 /DNA_ID=CAMNT_0007348965 /DNA_START=195 /DNA_END=1982 /DNA_ORIENTATION=+
MQREGVEGSMWGTLPPLGLVTRAFISNVYQGLLRRGKPAREIHDEHYRSELVRSLAPASSPPAVFKRLAADTCLGSFDSFLLDGWVWLYDRPLDVPAIRKAMTALVTKLPVLACRRTSGGLVLSNAGARFSVCEGYPGSALDFIGKPSRETPLTDRPPSVNDGNEPLFNVRVTNFADGTSAIGISSPHILTDGQAYFDVVSAFAAALGMDESYDFDSLPDFDSAPLWEAAMPKLDLAGTSTRWFSPEGFIPVRLWDTFCAPAWAQMNRGLVDELPRARVHITQAEVTELRAAIVAAQDDASKGRNVSMNEAISAAFLVALEDQTIASFIGGAPDVMKIGMVVRMLGKGPFKDAKGKTGNFAWVTAKDSGKPVRQMTVAEAADFFQTLGDEWRDSATADPQVELFAGTFMYRDVSRRVQTGGKYTVPGGVYFVTNNQLGFPSALIRFGPGSLIGYCPWHNGLHIHMVPATEPPAAHGESQAPASLVKKLVGSLDTRSAFARFDVNSCGSLTREDIAAGLKAVSVDVSAQELADVFNYFCKDVSGGIGLEEFNRAFGTARLAAGVDVYIPVPKRVAPQQIAYLQSAEFKHKLLYGWR